jgi:hypothetical protein
MLRIILQDLTSRNSFDNFIEYDIILNRFLLGMLSKTYVITTSLGLYSIQYVAQIGYINLTH